MLVPNVFTLLSLCAGLTAIRMAIELRYELAIVLVVVAALLDGVDGRWLARSERNPGSGPSSTALPTSSTSASRRR
jgi:phosphatidylserine synthase